MTTSTTTRKGAWREWRNKHNNEGQRRRGDEGWPASIPARLSILNDHIAALVRLYLTPLEEVAGDCREAGDKLRTRLLLFFLFFLFIYYFQQRQLRGIKETEKKEKKKERKSLLIAPIKYS